MAMVAQVYAQTTFSLRSPDARIEVKIRAADRIKYDVLYKGRPILQDAHLSMNVDHKNLGVNPKVVGNKQRSNDKVLEPVVRQKFAQIRDNYNESRIEFDGGYAVTFRAYNEGVAYRFETSLPQSEVHIYQEDSVFSFAGNYTVYYPQEESFFSHNERKYLPHPMNQLAPSALASLPAVIDAGDGVKAAIAESDLEEYPGLWLQGTSSNALAATFPPYPLKEQLERDRDFRVTEAADYLAVTKGTRTFPWRVIGIAEKDDDLITNQLVWLLEKPSQVQDTSWI